MKDSLRALKLVSRRQVLNIAFVGYQKVGKSSIIDILSLKKFDPKRSATSELEIQVAEVAFPNGQTQILIMTEIPLVDLNDDQNRSYPDDFDLICICAEKQISLKRFMEEHSEFLPPYVPKLGVCTKIELRKGVEGGAHAKFIKETWGISQLAECSSKNGDTQDLLRGIFEVMDHPQILKQHQASKDSTRQSWKPSNGAPSSTTLSGIICSSAYQSSQQSESDPPSGGIRGQSPKPSNHNYSDFSLELVKGSLNTPNVKR